MPKALILLEEGVEEAEFIYPYYRFREAGLHVDVCAPKAKETYLGKHGVPFRSDVSPDEVSVQAYDLIVIPGGRAPDRMRLDRAMVGAVREAARMGKAIAAICHGPQMLIEADILKGRKATCWRSVATDLKNAGARYLDREVVVDGNIVTARMPADLPAFCRETLRLLGIRIEKQSPVVKK
jgi:protease I